MNKLPTSFDSKAHASKMKDFTIKFVTQSQSEVKSTAAVSAWLNGSFDLDNCPKAAIDELRELAEIAEDKSKIALIDLFRLLMLNNAQADYILKNHWELIEVCIFGYLSC